MNGAAKKILFVDDDGDFLTILGYRLRHCGYVVETAISAEAAIKKVATFTPDLFLLGPVKK